MIKVGEKENRSCKEKTGFCYSLTNAEISANTGSTQSTLISINIAGHGGLHMEPRVCGAEQGWFTVPIRSAFRHRQERNAANGAIGGRLASQATAGPRKMGMGRAWRRLGCRKSSLRSEERQTMTPTQGRKSVEQYAAFLVIVVVMAAGILLMEGLMRLADSRTPQAGDIITFPATHVASADTTSFTARRALIGDRGACILDVQTMKKLGGSLVVEASQFEPARMFQVHWAGVRTSGDRDDCGSSADLLLNSYEISALIFAAGGTGVKAQN